MKKEILGLIGSGLLCATLIMVAAAALDAKNKQTKAQPVITTSPSGVTIITCVEPN